MPYDQNYRNISDRREFWFKRFIICLHRVTRMWVQLLCVLMHVFQLPANWLDVFLYNKLCPPRNDANKYVICIIIILFPVLRVSRNLKSIVYTNLILLSGVYSQSFNYLIMHIRTSIHTVYVPCAIYVRT